MLIYDLYREIGKLYWMVEKAMSLVNYLQGELCTVGIEKPSKPTDEDEAFNIDLKNVADKVDKLYMVIYEMRNKQNDIHNAAVAIRQKYPPSKEATV